MPDPVIHELPMRWADLDSLNHVNNVVYLDYAAESLALLRDSGVVAADEQPARVAIDFHKPLLLSRRPVRVVSSRDGATVTQDIGSTRSDTVFARVVTELGPRQHLVTQSGLGDPLPSRVRRSDLDASGAVGTTKLFELFQEGRILFLTTHVTAMTPGRFVAAHVEVEVGEPLSWRLEPYEATSWVSRVGASSVTIESQLADGATVHGHSRTVLVGFDLEAQTSRTLSHEERQELEALLR